MDEKKRYRLIIAGGGLSGLSAAIEAKEQGLENVLVLEKSNAPGGNGIFPDLMVRWDGKRPDLPVLDDDGLSENDPRISEDPQKRADAIFKKTMEWNHWRCDARLVRTLINESQRVFPWIEGMLKDEDYVEDPHLHKSHMHGRQIKVMLRRCKELGVEIQTKTTAKKIVLDGSGRVSGIICEKDGKEIRLLGDFVILACGGFLGDPDLMSKYLQNFDPDTEKDFIYLGRKYSGDGVKMAFEAGAADDGTVAFECDPVKTPWNGPVFTPCRDFFDNVRNPELIWLSDFGERFADESRLNATNSIYRLPHKRCYIFFNEALKQKIEARMEGKWRTWLYPKSKNDFNAEFSEMIRGGHMICAKELSDIASFIGCDEKILSAAISEYNEDCKRGRDSWFLKRADSLFAFEEPPYYVSRVPMPMIASRGPVRVNLAMNVLRKGDLKPIEGLYMSGVDIGGTDSDCYAGCSPSHSSLFAVASGRIAARSCAGILRFAQDDDKCPG